MYWRLEKKEDFYKTLVEMWKLHNFPVMPYQRVANRIFVAYGQESSESNPIVLYAVQVYITDSSMCQIAFPTSNISAPKKLKEGVLEALINIIQVCMKYEGYDFIYTTSENPKLMELFENKGFQASDEGVTYYSKLL